MRESVTHRRRWATFGMTVAVCMSLPLTASCGDGVESMWRDRSVSIDGENTEWSGAIREYDDDMSVGIMNDADYLYISLFISDRQTQAQILSLGCTLWLDSSGEEDARTFGVHFPVGLPAEERDAFRQELRGTPSLEVLQQVMDAGPAHLELVGTEVGVSVVQMGGAGGVEVATKLYSSSLIYEIKVPLVQDDLHPYAIGTMAGEEITVGLETPDIAQLRRAGSDSTDTATRGRGGGRGGGGRGGGGGGRGGGGGGRGGRGGGASTPSTPSAPEPLSVWTKIRLDTYPGQAEG